MALYMITIVIVKARGIIHIAFRVHALSNVIKMLATSGSVPPCTVSLTMLSLVWYCPGVYTCLHMGRFPQFPSHHISCLTSKSRSTTTDVSP